MRKCPVVGVLAILTLPILATTLQQLSLRDLSSQSTSIVRARLQPSYTALRGTVLYTHYKAQVSEVWKGASVQQVDVAVPGGELNGMRQTYSGAPTFTAGQDYVLFLWTSGSGLTQLMGLSQGLFNVSVASGVPVVTRAASGENFLSAGGQAINDTNFSMRLIDFHTDVNQFAGGRGANQ